MRAAELAARGTRTRFVGYDQLEVATTVTGVADLDGSRHLVKLAESPFYAQGGGQISDRGWIATDGHRREVTDVLRVGDDQVLVVAGAALAEGAAVIAHVDVPSRRATQANHTGTHVLNWALRERLGSDVKQAGSYVGPDKLRFDFTHRGRVPREELEEIERLVNARVAEDSPVTWTEMPKHEADALGAIGLFGEKYGDVVRVVSAGDFSKELCGGTHVARTSEIGPFKIVTETSVGSGARRIEAITGAELAEWHAHRARGARARARRPRRAHRRARARAQARPAGPRRPGGARRRRDRRRRRAGRRRRGRGRRCRRAAGDLGPGQARARRSGGRRARRAHRRARACWSPTSARARWPRAARQRSILKEIAPLVGGGGGGRETMARAGGKDPSRLPAALAAARALFGTSGA